MADCISKEKQWREYSERQYPFGKIPDKRKILRCSNSEYWYANDIGKIITVHYFATFGAWDTAGRWLDYYDLSLPIQHYFWYNRLRRFIYYKIWYKIKYRTIYFFKRLFT